MHPSDAHCISHKTTKRIATTRLACARNEIRQKASSSARFGWIMLHFLHCRHPFFIHARAQPASKPPPVAASSVPPIPPGPGPNLVPPKLCQNLAYSCPSLFKHSPSPLLHRLAWSFNRRPPAKSLQHQLPGSALSPSLSRRHNNASSRPQVYISRSYRRLSMSYPHKAVP